jgi:hypothetical protein
VYRLTLDPSTEALHAETRVMAGWA